MLRHLAGLTAALVLGALPALAAPAEMAADHVAAELVVRNAVTAPGESTDIAVRHALADGWHTYWLNPGDSGEPPMIDFTLSSGTTAGPVLFPVPERLPYPPLMNFGYSGEFTLLTSVPVPADWPAGEPYRVPVRIDWLVCEKICIPESGTAELTIPTGPVSQADSGVAFTFVQAEWALPAQSDMDAAYSRADGTIYLTVPSGEGEGAVFFPEKRGLIDNAAEQTSVDASDGEGFTLAVAAGRGRLDGTLRGVLKTDAGAWWISASGKADPAPVAAVAVAGAASAPGGSGGGTLAALDDAAPRVAIGPLEALLFAFLGGLILNLMPCVFPVLALKVFGLVEHASAPFARRAMIGAAYTSGILTSFAVLAGVLLTLKGAGVAVGWGFQLQSPVFVGLIAAAIFAVGLNLSGVFEIGTGLTRLGGRGPQDGVAGSFATGVLATIVATPCTAPFMAVAIGMALGSSAMLALGVFMAMGVGLGLPFVLLALMPGLSRLLPRPGAWMVRFKQALAFPLYATAAWLVWVLAQLVGVDALFGAFLALLLVALAAWLLGLAQRGGGRSHRVAAVLAGISLVAAGVAGWPSVSARPPAVAATMAGTTAFTPQSLEALRGNGQPVFLNVTAAWCITCKVNERVVFESDAFETLLADTGTTMMTADWTRRDPDVTALMDGFGRAGVPLYIYYPAAAAPEVLPQILTISALQSAFATR
ncbi:protein-disulfide reductase DsbD family protein [Acuticoccus sp. MNP-M23]|uniref:protein-disulfide reductase DsbD family protein n=1 Tax=Acuticoccus sp. MNP-M23 TaxID=3072793 RepID=UPI0028168186|nr:protein-disulfide reductase DsbD domain-containing protein [Acuticoccus sp. MNP-M23]WMS42819.1 protein-disulfide reductase DsbD family protein [Acuticoccus sp. MNP-M23]